METTKNHALIDSLIKHGYYLSYLVRESKTKDDEHLKNLVLEFKEATKKALEILENVQISDTFPTEKVVERLLNKIKATVEDFEKLDSDSNLGDLKKQIDGCSRSKVKPPASQSVNGDGSGGGGNQQSDDLQATVIDHSSFPWKDDHDGSIIDYNAAFSSLHVEHKNCLLFCYDLFPRNNEGHFYTKYLIIRKRKLIHWWIGFELVENLEKGKQVLDKLVEEEFLIPTSSLTIGIMPRLTTNQALKGYIIHASTKPTGEGSTAKVSRRCDGTMHVIEYTDRNSIAVINADKYTLDKRTVDAVIAIDSKKVAILHLGGWTNDPAKRIDKSRKNDKSANYVVVEDIDALESFLGRQWPNMITLSLQGIGGIVELPESVYKIQTLKVLDLKACPNLEKLPSGINSLKKLTHLDVSQCYLLNHIPRGLDSLTNLKVLKGFIVNPEYDRKGLDDCAFDRLTQLTNLISLAVRARTTSFPTSENLNTISKMTELKKLKVIWVQNISSYDTPEHLDRASDGSQDTVFGLPSTLAKLELQAAPELTAARMLDLISQKSSNCPVKLYIRGGGLWKLDPYSYYFPNVEVLRLRYLPELHMKWSDCQVMFPKLSHLEVFQCPNLVDFPCGENGLWNEYENC